MAVFSLLISALYLWAWLWWIFKPDHTFSEWNDPAKYTCTLRLECCCQVPDVHWEAVPIHCGGVGFENLCFNGLYLFAIFPHRYGFCCTDWFPPLSLLIACFQFCALLTVHFSLQWTDSVCMLGVYCLCDSYTVCSVHIQLNLVGNAIIFVSEHIVHFCCFWTHALLCI